MSLIESLNWRYAVKTFNRKKLPLSQLNYLIESIRLSPSAFGLQPFKLFIVESDRLKGQLTAACFEQPQILSCSHLFIFAAQTSIAEDDISLYIKELAHTQQISESSLNSYKQQIIQSLLGLPQEQQQKIAQEQCFIALGTLLAAAAIKRIDACPMTGFNVDELNQILTLPEQNLTSVVLCPLGFRAETDHTAHRQKHRKSKLDLVVNL
ncbi:nitroreductase family protein [Catenovulum sp. 2E275]|uniref:nitroreductase family protein n=1 Tax=Catenovulum sp. 2E275 TaxID=2980497 RepID=UPI0021D3432C|nr:nitroreductase family protein [Catenovulum sp. 2E275]MCU4675382.1 nitroreductase family protein [Catenovulum sp. 2E275]